MSNKVKECKEFLLTNKVTFSELVRCVNFWNDLAFNERIELIEAYAEGQFAGVGGWY